MVIDLHVIKKIISGVKKIAWKSRGSLGPHGQPGVLTLTYLQSLGSNIRLEIAKVAQKSLIHFVMGVLITYDQCDMYLCMCIGQESLFTLVSLS